MKNIFLILMFIVGTLTPIQGAINSKLGRLLDNSFFGALISFSVGTVLLIIINLAYRTNFSNISLVWSQPWYIWMGGFIGASFVTSVIIATPSLGTTLTFALVIAGQLTMMVMIDHFGWFDIPVKPVNIYRILGIILLAIGVVLVRKF